MNKNSYKIYKKKSGTLLPISFKKNIPFATKRLFIINGKKIFIEVIMLITNVLSI